MTHCQLEYDLEDWYEGLTMILQMQLVLKLFQY